MSELPASRGMPRRIAIDAHAHLRSCFDLSTALHHAAKNFGRGLPAGASGAAEPLLGILLLAETVDCHTFGELTARSTSSGAWSFQETGEAAALLAHDPAGSTLVLVAGRQVATRERLEVLSLGSAARLEEGAPIGSTLEEIRESGGLAVLPWGFGKWWGPRGEIVRGIVAESRPGELFLGDNGNRPAPGRRPALFREAEARGLRVLPGSDPLSIPYHVRRLGCYGFALPTSVDLTAPVEDLKRLLRETSTPIATIGHRERPLAFLVDQLRQRRH